MGKRVLDDLIVKEEDLGFEPGWINWNSICILWGGVGYCILTGIGNEIKVIAGIFVLFISTLLYYFKYEVGVKYNSHSNNTLKNSGKIVVEENLKLKTFY